MVFLVALGYRNFQVEIKLGLDGLLYLSHSAFMKYIVVPPSFQKMLIGLISMKIAIGQVKNRSRAS